MPSPVTHHPSTSRRPARLRRSSSGASHAATFGYGIALYRRPTAMIPDVNAEQVVRISGDPLLSIMDRVLAVIRRAGYRSTDLKATRNAPFRIHAEAGAARLVLLFAALKPFRKGRRIEKAARTISVHGARRDVLLVQQGDGWARTGANSACAEDHGVEWVRVVMVRLRSLAVAPIPGGIFHIPTRAPGLPIPSQP